MPAVTIILDFAIARLFQDCSLNKYDLSFIFVHTRRVVEYFANLSLSFDHASIIELREIEIGSANERSGANL